MDVLLKRDYKKYSHPAYFFAVTYTLTWVFWIPAALLKQDHITFSIGVLIALGGIFGKALPAIIIPYLTQGREGWRDYWDRVIDFKRISPVWYGVILLAMPLFSFLGILTDIATGGSMPAFTVALHYLGRPLTILPFVLFILLFGPLPEELGWRGYVLDRLQSKRNALSSSLILGILWVIWHLPLFFIAGTYQHDEVVFGSLRFWLCFVLSTMAVSILMTWVYNNNRRSTLSAVLIHFMLNFTGEFLDLPDQQELYRALWTILAAAGVTALWKPGTLTSRSEVLEKEVTI